MLNFQVLVHVCSTFQGMSSSSRPPRDLNSLLDDIRVPSDVDRCRWARAFVQHLRKNGDGDAEALMDFCVIANTLRLKGEEGRDEGGRKKVCRGHENRS